MIKMINTTFEQSNPEISSMDLSRKLLETVMEMDVEPTRAAIDFIKAEVGRII